MRKKELVKIVEELTKAVTELWTAQLYGGKALENIAKANESAFVLFKQINDNVNTVNKRINELERKANDAKLGLDK